MLAQQAPPIEVRYQRLQWALVAVVVLALVGLIAITGYTYWQANQPAGTALHQEAADQLARDVSAIWTSHDATMVGQAYAPDAIFVDPTGRVTTGSYDIGRLVTSRSVNQLRIAVTGNVLTDGQYVVARYSEHFVIPDVGARQGTTLSVFKLDDHGLIEHQWVLMLVPYTPTAY
jgi:cytoskeletal protein RodZ